MSATINTVRKAEMSVSNILKTFGAAAFVATTVLMVGMQVHAEPTRATMPDIDKLVHYTTVNRGEVTEHIMTTREAIEAVKAGQPIPNGTHVALVDYRDGKVFRYFIMEKARTGDRTTPRTVAPPTGSSSGSSRTARSTWTKTPRAVSAAIRRGRTGTFYTRSTKCAGSNSNDHYIPRSPVS